MKPDGEERWLYLDGGTLDFGVVRFTPWRWWQRPRWAWRAWWKLQGAWRDVTAPLP